MLESSARFTLFDYFRVPYKCGLLSAAADDGLHAIVSTARGRTLTWPTRGLLDGATREPAAYRLGSIPIFGRVIGDAEVRDRIPRLGGSWEIVHPIYDRRETPVSAIWRRDDGSVFLSFDPNEVILNYWTETYLEVRRAKRAISLAREGYYLARPLMSRRVQLTLRRKFARLQSRTRFPRWPIETALHDLYALLFDLVIGVTREPVPYIGIWPGSWTWALVLTHDVEAQTGYAHLRELLDAELELGYRSSWNFVPDANYVVEGTLLQELRDDGFEIGVHGLHHDGRDISESTLPQRLPKMRSYAETWNAVGFRSPSTLRSAAVMPALGFEYDSSYSDTAPFEPQAGGCCTWFPYMLEDLVELPITLPQDHTVFDLLRHRDETLWMEKARFLRAQGGMALVVTHPDYVRNPDLVPAYRNMLEAFASDPSAWKVVPRDVCRWWRRRAESTLRIVHGEWHVNGPAENEASVRFMRPGVVTQRLSGEWASPRRPGSGAEAQ